MDKLKYTALSTLLAMGLGGGCADMHRDTVQDLENAFDRMDQAIRSYHVEVLLPALSMATEDQRAEYRRILDHRFDACGREPPRFGRREWERCLLDKDREAAEVIGVEPFQDYLLGREATPPPPGGIRAGTPQPT